MYRTQNNRCCSNANLLLFATVHHQFTEIRTAYCGKLKDDKGTPQKVFEAHFQNSWSFLNLAYLKV